MRSLLIFFGKILLLLLLAAIPLLVPGARQDVIWDEPELQEDEVRLSTVLGFPNLVSVLWIDARSAEEYAEGHIPGAILLNEQDWDELLFTNLEQIAMAPRVVIYCNSLRCDASHHVAERLRTGGYASGEVLVLHNGWQAWIQERPLDVETGEGGAE